MTEPRRSNLFNILAQRICASVLGSTVKDAGQVAAKARALCYATPARRDAAVNSIYVRCEADLQLPSVEQLRAALKRLRPYSAQVQDTGEFWRLYDGLSRFTHSTSFFTVCMPTVVAMLATLLTLVLANQLLYAAEIVEDLEGYLLDAQKPLSQDLADLLEMKYGLINLVQYRMLPLVLGVKHVGAIAGASARADADAGDGTFRAEVEQLLELPVRTGIIDGVYQHLISSGVNAANNYAEFVAGLKISEIAPPAPPAAAAAPAPAASAAAPACAAAPAASVCAVAPRLQALPVGLRRLAAAAAADPDAKKVLELAANKHSGRTLDGSVTTPLTEVNHIPLSSEDMEKFMLLDYLYTMRLLASCVKKKNSRSQTRTSPGVKLTISSPFKIIAGPGK